MAKLPHFILGLLLVCSIQLVVSDVDFGKRDYLTEKVEFVFTYTVDKNIKPSTFKGYVVEEVSGNPPPYRYRCSLTPYT